MKSERRYLSVMMCDLVGSTELSDTLDPDEFGSIIETAINTCADIVEEYSGTVSAYQGDSIIALFGYPKAVELHACQAVNAGLEIVNRIDSLGQELDIPLAIRVGIASGTSVVSPVMRKGSIAQLTAYGYVPNLSGRLQSAAESNTVLLDSRTHRLTKQYFKFEDHGSRQFKGFEQSKRVWRPLSASTDSRTVTAGSNDQVFLGRSSEMSSLYAQVFETDQTIDNSIVSLTGEPGIGKSGLVQAFLQHNAHACHVATLFCNNLLSTTPFYPFTSALIRQLRIDDNQSIERQRDSLKTSLSRLGIDSASHARPLYALFGLNLDTEEPIEQIKESLAEIVYQILFNDGDTRKNILLVEDVQWLDSASTELLDSINRQYPDMSILVTSRKTPVELPFNRLTGVHLEPLTSVDSAALIDEIAPRSLTKDQKKSIITKAEGVPLFIQEFVATAISQQENHSNRISEQQDIPDTLQFTLLTRLDSLGENKRDTSIAALIGREFDHEVFKEVSSLTDEEIDTLIENLVDANIFSIDDKTERSTIRFRHALLQDAAAILVPAKEQQTIHSRIADVILGYNQAKVEYGSSVVAYHLSEAKRFEEALTYWKSSAKDTAKTWAKLEAADQYEQAIRCLEIVDQNNQALELELQRSLGDVLYAALGHATDTSKQAFTRAIALSQELGDTDAEAQVLDGLFGIHFNSADFSAAEDACNRLVKLSESTRRDSQASIAIQGVGMCHYHQGNLSLAKSTLESALALLSNPESINSDFPSMAYLYLSATCQLMGQTEEANRNYELAKEFAERGNPYNVAAVLGNGCHLYQFQNRPDMIQKNIDNLIPICEAHGFNMWLTLAQFFSSWLQTMGSSGRDEMTYLNKVFDELEDDIEKPYYAGLIAKAELRLQAYERADAMLDIALSYASKNNEHYYTAELLRTQATVASHCGDLVRQADLLSQAKTLATDQQAALWLQRMSEDTHHSV